MRAPSSTFTLVLVVVVVGNRVVAKSSLRWKTLQFILVELLFYFLFFFFFLTPCCPSQKPLPDLSSSSSSSPIFPIFPSHACFCRREKREASKPATLERFLGRYSLSSLTLVARVSIDDTERVRPPDQSPNSSSTHKVPKSNQCPPPQ